MHVQEYELRRPGCKLHNNANAFIASFDSAQEANATGIQPSSPMLQGSTDLRHVDWNLRLCYQCGRHDFYVISTCCFFDQFQAGTKRIERTAAVWPQILLRTICRQQCCAEAPDSAAKNEFPFQVTNHQEQRKPNRANRANRAGRCGETITQVT